LECCWNGSAVSVIRLGAPLLTRNRRFWLFVKFSRSSTRKPPCSPNFRLCAPVTYDADARHVNVPFHACSQFIDRYVRLGMPPLAAQPAEHCSFMRTRSRVGLPGVSNGPHAERYVPSPASRSRRLVTGDVHVACCARWP